jgi:hypothetical protein
VPKDSYCIFGKHQKSSILGITGLSLRKNNYIFFLGQLCKKKGGLNFLLWGSWVVPYKKVSMGTLDATKFISASLVLGSVIKGDIPPAQLSISPSGASFFPLSALRVPREVFFHCS